ncbi:MAG: hypothetical protein EA384_01180 [Spirochaetaceae bacterium]|nr:MAG: hypothetical protein EA384_01180 [Spirochaetaceae bacterium]
MYGSERFRRRLLKIPRTHPDASPEQRVDLARSGFAGCLSGFPEGLVDDLFEYFHDKNAPLLQANATLPEYGERMGALLDLFLLDYDVQGDPLPREDWEFIRDSIDAFAVDMDMDVVNYVMALIVEKGAL